jgi:hypothetical protein
LGGRVRGSGPHELVFNPNVAPLVIAIETRPSDVFPVFVTLNDRAGVVPPTGCVPKSNGDGEISRAPAARPTPLKIVSAETPGSETTNVDARAPAAPGENVTLNVHVAPTASDVLVQPSLLTAKSAPSPPRVMPSDPVAPVPTLLTSIDSEKLIVPIVTPPKS